MASIPETTTALVLREFNKPLVLDKSPTPTPGPGSVLVRVLSTPLRPQLRAAFQGKGFFKFPLPYNPGHCAVARVLAVGPDATALQPGQLVYVDGFVVARDDPAGVQVILGLSEGFDDRSRRLYAHWGGMCRDVALVSLERCVALDEAALTARGYSFADMVYLDRLSVAYGGFCAAGVHAGDTLIVNPATGQYSGAVVELAASLGCRVLALTRSVDKLAALAARFPGLVVPVQMTGDAVADQAAIRAACPPGSGGADALVDLSPWAATSNPASLTAALAAVRGGGHVALMGAMGTVPFDYMSLMFRSINVKFQFMFSREELSRIVRLVENGAVALGRAAGHQTVTFALEQAEEGYRVAEQEALGWGSQAVLLL